MDAIVFEILSGSSESVTLSQDGPGEYRMETESFSNTRKKKIQAFLVGARESERFRGTYVEAEAA